MTILLVSRMHRWPFPWQTRAYVLETGRVVIGWHRC